jgi:hypothetical protein
MSTAHSTEYNEELLAQFKTASTKSSVSTEASTKVSTDGTALFDTAFTTIAKPLSVGLGSTWNGDINYKELTTDQLRRHSLLILLRIFLLVFRAK